MYVLCMLILKVGVLFVIECFYSFLLLLLRYLDVYMSMLIKKLHCQHSLLMGKVTVSLGGGLGIARGEGGWIIEQGVEGQREARYLSGT